MLPKGLLKNMVRMVFLIPFIPVLFLRFRVAPTPLLGLRSKAEPEKNAQEIYLERTSHYYKVSARINKEMPKDVKIFLYRDVYPYYIEREVLLAPPNDQGYIQYHKLTPERLYARLKEEGVTHVLVFERFIGIDYGYSDFYTKVSDPVVLPMLKRHGVVVFQEGDYKMWVLGEATFQERMFVSSYTVRNPRLAVVFK